MHRSSVAELSRQLAARHISSVELTRAYLERIERLNGTLNAFITVDAERSLARSYELDAGNPVTGYTLASLLYQRGDYPRAQFYIRRMNNSDLANAETLWLGIKVERRLNDRVAMLQLAEVLKKRFPKSREVAAYERGAFDE